jgi:hypothetical protein
MSTEWQVFVEWFVKHIDLRAPKCFTNFMESLTKAGPGGL